MRDVAVQDGFDYRAISEDVAEIARSAANRIRDHERKAQDSLWEIGRELISVKESLGHGQFRAWIESEFGMSKATAHRYMSIAANIPSKCLTVRHLPPKALQALAKPTTPPEVREGLIERIEAGEVLQPYEVCDIVKTATDAERKTQKVARLKPDQKKSHARREASKAREEAKWREEQRRDKDAAVAAVARLQEHLGDSFAEIGSLIRDAGVIRFREALIMALEASN